MVKQNKKELNIQFEQLPEIEVDEFKIYVDGQLDRYELYKARSQRFLTAVGNVAYKAAERLAEDLEDSFDYIDEVFEGKHIIKY